MSSVLEGYKFGAGGYGTYETVTWSFETANFAAEPYSYTSFLTGQFQIEIQAELAAWEAVANIDFVEAADASSSNSDTGVEATESFFLNLSGATNGATIAEGNAETKVATFVVNRAGGTAAFTVDYATANNTAAAGSDHQAANGTLPFGAGVTTQTNSVVINGEAVVEPPESFFLSGATNGAIIADSQGVGTISNDDVAPVAGPVSSSVLEGYKFGAGGYGTSGGTVTWSFATANFADEPYSYTSFLTGQFQTEIRAALAAFEAVANIDFVEVADASSSLLRFGFVNDFPAFPWSPAIAGGPGGVAGQATVRYADNATPVIHLAEADIAFDARETWQVVNGNILTGPNGTRFFSIALHEIGHAIGLDHNETNGERSIMKASLDPSYNGLEAVDIQGVQTIYGAAAQPAGSVSIGDVIITEGDAGTKVATFVVNRAGGTAAFTVNYATANNTAAAGSDYQATSGTLSFGAGVTTQTISVVIVGDTVVEATESFFLNLSGATNGATIADSQGVGTISNDDVAPVAGSVSIGDVIITEGDAGTKVATFVVNRAGGTAAFTVDYATANNTAAAGSDYQATSGTLSFGAGVTTQTISVVIVGDTVVEATESFFLNLSGATNGATIADSQGVGTISNDDVAPVAGSVSIGDVIITEGDAGTKIATFVVNRAGGTAAFTVDYATANNTAAAGSDYQATSGTLSFGAGVTTQTISVVINGDTVVEATESFFLNLSGATNGAAIADSQGVGTISNDDVAPVAGSVSIGDVIITEGDAGTKVATFVVNRAGGTAAFTVDYATANNTAAAGSDYQATSGTLSFGAGVTTQTISVVINGDTVVEATESFFLNLSGATNGATIADSQGIGTISNDDVAPGDDFADWLSDTASPLGQLAINTPLAGNIETGGDSDVFRVNLVAGVTYNLRLQGLDSNLGTLFDPYLQFYNSTGQELAFDDDAGSGRESLIVYTANTTGIHYLQGLAFSDTQTGTYTISASTAQIRTGDANGNTFVAAAHAEAFGGLAGSDTVSYTDATAGVVASLMSASQNTGFAAGDTYNSIENLRGSNFADTLTGNSLANVLNGSIGADRMAGLAGNDTYYVDNAGDKVIEAINAGTDTVRSSVNFSLAGQNLERLILTGSANINGTGNSLANILTGNSGNNILNGGTGKDTMTGGGGGDFFRFNTTLNASTNVDAITDFQVNVDKIQLENTIFTAVGASLTAVEFVANASGAATNGSQHILYDTTDGRLFYDADGNGGQAKVHFATLNAGLALDHLDFLVI